MLRTRCDCTGGLSLLGRRLQPLLGGGVFVYFSTLRHVNRALTAELPVGGPDSRLLPGARRTLPPNETLLPWKL
jgi:hypothetical protein